MTEIVKQKREIYAWVELCGVIWIWHAIGKLVYKSTTKHQVGDPTSSQEGNAYI